MYLAKTASLNTRWTASLYRRILSKCHNLHLTAAPSISLFDSTRSISSHKVSNNGGYMTRNDPGIRSFATKKNRHPPSQEPATDRSWSQEWTDLGMGARLPKPDSQITDLLFVQVGFGVDQHGDRSQGATKAAVRAVRNAIEFNSIPGIASVVPGGREEMLIRVKLGVPPKRQPPSEAEIPMEVDLADVAKVFPYGRLLPVEVVVGGLSFPTGRIVPELGDEDDVAICCAASVSIGYDDGSRDDSTADSHRKYSTADGY